MVRGVNANSAAIRARRVADTEERLLQAATWLFVQDGYAGTTLAAVAASAGVAPRTVYLRFGTKAALLQRAFDVALVGDTAPVDVAHRDWVRRSMTAPTLTERIAEGAGGARLMMERVGPLLAVVLEAEPTEPEIAAAAIAGREATRQQMHAFWAAAVSDGLLAADADVAWLGDTTAVLGAAETYRLATRTMGWDGARYEQWVRTTWQRLATASTGRPR